MSRTVPTKLMVFSRFLFAALLFFVTSNSFGQTCTIYGSSTACSGQTVSFSSNCAGDLFDWRIDDVQQGTDANFSYTFPSAGTYKVSIQSAISGGGGGGIEVGGYAEKYVTIGVSPVMPVIQSTASEVCNTGNVTLSISNVQSGVTYGWHSVPAGLSGTGTSINFNGLNTTREFFVTASSAGCTQQASKVVTVAVTEITPVLDAHIYYRRRIIRGSADRIDHYWQTTSTGTEIIRDLTGDYTVTQDGNYYIRKRSIVGNCWTTASQPVAVTVGLVPPLPVVIQTKQNGYNEIIYTDLNKSHILDFADYYWVSDASTNPEIIRPFISNEQVVENRLYENGTHYLKGKDRLTGTWGATLSLSVTLRGDQGLNWIHLRSYDGSTDSLVVSESKNYFDEGGIALQTQTKQMETELIFATQPLNDRYNRTAGSTLPAPILPNQFTYHSDFFLDAPGNKYAIDDFDAVETITNPNPAGSSKPGTVGWYYSSENTLEPNVGKTHFPYSRVEYYEDGTGEQKRSTSPGDHHRLGAGHETLTGKFPVFNELNDYLIKRSIATSGILDDGSLMNEGVQTIARDVNGRYTITITDKGGKTLMTARNKGEEENDHVLEVSNTIIGNANENVSPHRRMIYFYLLDSSPVTISVHAGPVNTVYGSTVSTANYAAGQNNYIASRELRLLPGFSATGGQTFVGMAEQPGHGWSVENLITGERLPSYQTFEDSNGKWPAGFYRVIVHTGQASVTYSNYFQDVSYQFYDDMGRLKTSISPNGVRKWIELEGLGTAFSAIDKTTYTYNFKGNLLSITEPDAGMTTYKYRQDGKIRYSQNALQSSTLKFSYTHYDNLARPIESGEYKGSGLSYSSSLDTLLEYSDQVIFSASETKDWVKTHYDYPDDSLYLKTGIPSSYTQQFTSSAVSTTENEHVKTWYSYDELGRVAWLAQKPKKLNRTFLSTYEYDFLGNVMVAGTFSFENGVLHDSFYHHYNYDKDKKLKQAFTSTDGVNKILRATYHYYLHGPLKRVELGNGIQGIDFVYNIHGWLTYINHPSLETTNDPGGDGSNGFRKDVFGMALDYYNSEMEDLFPTASVDVKPVTPAKFHKIPFDELPEDNDVEIAFNPGIVMPSSQQQWTNQIDQIKEYFSGEQQRSELVMHVSAETDLPSATADNVTSSDLIPVWQPDRVFLTETYQTDLTVDDQTLIASATGMMIPADAPTGNVDDALEFAALKALYDSLNGSSWQIKTNWPTAGNWPASATAAQMDTWHGIVVANGDITEIALNSIAMTGKIPAAIGNLTALTSLNMRSNNLNGKIPVAITTLTNLVTLDLYQNQFTGGIPSQIGNLTNLVTLRLYNNATLGGTIPASIGQLTNLKTLYLQYCGLTSSIQPALKKLHQLENLDISGNTGMTGVFPPLGQLTNLKTLNAYSLTGLTLAPIPAWIDSLRDLTSLNLESSKRNGSIPTFLGNLEELQALVLRNNSLSGSIPLEIANLENLTGLALNNNQLTGSIPANMGDLVKLTVLHLHQNQLSGSIPISLYTFRSLTNLQLQGNRLSGIISENIGDLDKLTVLDLSSNQFTGEIPRRLGNITPLLSLMLNSNSLSGEIPEALTTLVNLQTFHLNHNRLSGVLPDLSLMNKIQFLQLHNNQFSGVIGSWIGSLNQLRTFRIDDNFFTEIDAALMNSPQLTNVYLNNNRLVSVPNFYTYSNKANLNLYVGNNYLDFGDLEPLFGTGTHGIKTFTWSPQRKFSSVTKLHVPAGEVLQAVAPPRGSFGTVVWEKFVSNNWISVTGSNQDVTQQTYQILNASSTINGTYRWRMTSTRVSGLTLESTPIEIIAVDELSTVSGPVLYNGFIASSRWKTEAPDVIDGEPLVGMYIYDYDQKYQVKDARWAEPNYLLNTFTLADNKYRVTGLGYDPNGNIDSLRRFDQEGIRTNNFAYTYHSNKNRLKNVSGHAGYVYDSIGRMISEIKVSGEAQYVEYDVSGKVTAVSKKGIDQTDLAGNYYFSNSNNNQTGAMGAVNAFNGATFGIDRNNQATSAYSLDGVNDYLTIDDPESKASFGAADFTVSFWVKRNALANNWSNTAGVSKWNSGSAPGSNEWNVSIGNGAYSNNPLFSIESGTTLYSVSGTTNLQQGQWYHLSGVRENGYLKIYVNGQAEDSVFVGSVAINNSALPMYVGRYHNGYYSNAVFDDIKIYNRALSEAEIDQLIANENQQIVKVRYQYDDRGFRISKTVYPHATATTIGHDVRTTWYIRNAVGATVSIYEQDGEPAVTNNNPVSQTEIPIYGSGKLGTYYPVQDGSTNYEITDHLGNVRTLVRDNINVYIATMEDNEVEDITNPRVQEGQYFQNIFETEAEDSRFNHTPGGEYSAYLYWINGSANQHKAVGPAITLKVSAGDTLKAETWVRFENKPNYSRNINIASVAALLSGNFSFTSGFEGFTMPQATTSFSNALTLAGFMGDGAENDVPFAYLNYIIFDENMVMVDADWKRVDEEMGFDPGQESLLFHQHKKLALDNPIHIPQNGYIYIWVSNESEGTKVWFDDIKVTHSQVMVTQSMDYGVWGDVLRELKQPDFTYRHGYQGQFSEADKETGWNHFELREYDPVIGKWTSRDPYRQYWSPYVGMGNNPVNGTDPDGGFNDYIANKDGTFCLLRETSDDFDVIYAEGATYHADYDMVEGAVVGIVNKGFVSTSLNLFDDITFINVKTVEDQKTYKEFILNYSKYVDKEMVGLNINSKDGVDDMFVAPTATNTFKTAPSLGLIFKEGSYDPACTTLFLKGNAYKLNSWFHTHPGSNRPRYGYPITSPGDQGVADYLRVPGWIYPGRGGVDAECYFDPKPKK